MWRDSPTGCSQLHNLKPTTSCKYRKPQAVRCVNLNVATYKTQLYQHTEYIWEPPYSVTNYYELGVCHTENLNVFTSRLHSKVPKHAPERLSSCSRIK